MAGHGHHSFNGPPKPPVAHVPRVYRFTATALGAGMWFFVSRPDELRLEASDGSEHQRQDYEDCMLTNYNTAYVQGEEGRYVTKYTLQCGLLVIWATMANSLQVPFSLASSTLGTTKRLPCTITSFPATTTTRKALGADIKGYVDSMQCT
jgi:hypothetical protein